MENPKFEEYKGWTIEPYFNDYSWEHVAYPSEQGIQHDYDWNGENWKYCGNCKFGSIKDLKNDIDELIESAN